MQQKCSKYPFSLISSQGLGTTYSSLEKIGALLPMEGFGAAGLMFYPNIATGNLVFNDRFLKIDEQGGPIYLGLTYNSLAEGLDKLWQFSCPQFIDLSQANHIAVFCEHDGHLTHYTFNADKNIYYAPNGSKQGTPWVRFDEQKQQWIRYQPGKNITEYYNVQGLLLRRENAVGQVITFEYNEGQQLAAIMGQSGSRYEIRRVDKIIEIYLTGGDLKEQLLQLYKFDDLGRLVFTQTPDGYETEYQYNSGQEAWQLLKVKQVDQTFLRFNYDDKKRLWTFNLGQKAVFTLQYPNKRYSKFHLIDAFKGITELSLNASADITEVSCSQCFDSVGKDKDTTTYTYNNQDQLTCITHPSGGEEYFHYIQPFGLVQSYTQPNDQTMENVYQVDGDKVRRIGKIHYENINDKMLNIPLVTRFVYDTEYNANKEFLRFTITPEGKVTEYRPNEKGNIASQREYLGGVIHLSQSNPHISPSLEEMQEWMSKQDPQQVTLTEYGYSPRGQLVLTRKYAHVDAQGNGIVDDETGATYVFSDLFGNWFSKEVKQDSNTVSITKRSFDKLQRITSETNALKQTTTYSHLDAKGQLEITYPNGRKEVHQKDDKNKIIGKQETVAEQVRETKYGRDTNGRVVFITRPDGEYVYNFYDHQDRLGFTVTASGIVTQYTYDLKNRYTAKIDYAQPINPEQLWLVYPPEPGFLPIASKLIQLLKTIQNPQKDRISYIFKDYSGRPIYSVDADQYATQYVYNQRNQKTLEIVYSDENRLTDVQLAQLKQGQNLVLPVNFTKDRVTRYFYDKDSQLIGKQNCGGYVAEYIRDNAQNVKEKIHYDTKVTIDLNIQDFDQIRPQSSARDAHTYYFYNSRNKIIGIVTSADKVGEYYYTQHLYYPNGLKQKTIQYAAKVTSVSSQPPPPMLEQDNITTYQYDLLGRSFETHLPNKKVQSYQYDVSGNILFQQSKDLENPDKDDADHQRTVKAHYDGWNQKVQETNLFGGEIVHHYDPITRLKTHTTDCLNRTTYYFYDIDKRLVATVSPTGAITENVVDAFGDVVKVIRYYNKIPKAQITEGGYLTPDIRKLFVLNLEHDEINCLGRNKRGLVIEKIDPNDNSSTYNYNAFKQIIEEHLPVENKTPTFTITHEFDVRGLEIKTTWSAEGTLKKIIERSYDNRYGKKTYKRDSRNGEYLSEYGLRGLVVQKTKKEGTNTSNHNFTYTAFKELETETDALGHTTIHSYNVGMRTHTIQVPISDVTKTLTQNIFDETIQEKDSLENTKVWSHAPNGTVEAYTDPLGQTSNAAFDLMGQLKRKIDANQIETNFSYDDEGHLRTQTQDASGLKLKITYQRDSFGNATSIIDARGIVTQNAFDRKNQLIETVRDENEQGLNLILQKTYNAQGRLTSEIQGDKTNPTQYQETYHNDGRNRNIGKTIDPHGLKLGIEHHLNAAGDVIAELDCNGNITRKFYDALGQIRFIVDPEGGIQETSYDAEGRIHYTCLYEQGLSVEVLNKLNDQTDLKTLLNLVKRDSQDTLLYHFYDADGKERFQVSGLGAVGESQYDLARREVKIIKYMTPINAQLLPQLTTEQVSKLIIPNAEDRIIYKILDAKGQERFLIDSSQYISEKRYDANGNVITKVAYATQVADPAKIAVLSPDQVLKTITLDPSNDRSVYQVFDSCNNPEYIVDAEQGVTQFGHDENNNLIRTCVYHNKITIPDNYDELVTLLKKLTPSTQIDRITQDSFDHADRKISMTDQLGYIDKFKKDTLGNTIVHTDRANHDWIYHYDAANRLDIETTPSVTVTIVEKTTANNNVQLNNKDTEMPIENKKFLDSNGNECQVIKASNSTIPRTLDCAYNKCNQLVQTRISGVLIADDSKEVSFDNPPVKSVDITTQVIYNAKKLKICEQNETGGWFFYIYNSDGRLVYEIDPIGGIKRHLRNTYNEITTTVQYDTPIDLDLSQYTKTGISLEKIQEQGIVQTSKNDRIKTYERDHRGDITSIRQGQTFYYLPNGTAHPHYELGYSQIQQTYNAFRQCFYKAVLADPQKQVWAQQLYWFDRNGNIVADCDPEYKVIRYSFNSFNNEVQRVEWANKPKQLPMPATSLFQLDASHQPSLQDRTFVYEYDLAGQCTQQTIKQVVVQSVSFGTNNIPHMKDLAPQDLTQKYQYNALRQRVAVIYEDNSAAYNYYNALGLKIAVTDVRRDRQGKGNGIIPLSYFGYNVFGQQIKTTRFKQGTTEASPNKLPIPVSMNPDDQTDLKYLDNRGLPQFTQNAESAVQGFTYNEMRKVKLQYYRLTQTYGPSSSIDAKKFNYDALNRPILMTLLRDNVSVETTASQYNTFGNCIAEGPGDGTWPLYRCFDVLNNCWADNAKGYTTITLRNLAGQETVQLQSPTQDLSLITYDQLNTVLSSWKITDLERQETQRDYLGRKIIQTKPVYSAPDNSYPADIPLSIVVGKNYPEFGSMSLSWVQPQDTTVTPQFTLWPFGYPGQKQRLEIKTIKDRCGVDVSNCDTDVYAYHIDYYFANPITGKPDENPQYQTEGKVQFDTGKNTNSFQPVVSVENEHILTFTGNTRNLTAVVLHQNNQKIAEIPVNSQNGKISADMSGFDSGIYTLVPIITGKENLPESLPFTIYTTKLSKLPLSKEIQSTFSLKFLEQNGHHGQLLWDVPAVYQNSPILITCKYYDHRNKIQVHEDSIMPKTDKGRYTDSKGEQLVCNTEFAFHVKKVIEIYLSIQINGAEKLRIAYNVKPTQMTGNGTDIILNTTFPQTTVLYITPLTGFSALPKLSYLDMTKGRLADRKQLMPIGMTGQGIIIDVIGFQPCIYPFEIADQLSGNFTVTGGSLLYKSDSVPDHPPVNVQPSYHFTYDHWNNLTRFVDTLNKVTDYTYNFANQRLTQMQPLVYVVQPDGRVTMGQPVTQWGYNERGFKIGEIDPNGNTQAFIVDCAGQEALWVVGDGVVVRTQEFNALGQRETHVDARGHAWHYQFNHRNSIVKITYPSYKTTDYAYNELNYRVKDVDQAKKETLYRYDVRGNIVERLEPSGYPVIMDYERNGLMTRIQNPDSTSMEWIRNYFGRLQSHIDLAGFNYHYLYDLKNQKVMQTSQGDKRETFRVFANSFDTTVFEGGGVLPKRATGYELTKVPVSQQFIAFHYRGGNLVKIEDTRMNARYDYCNDTEGRPIELSMYQDNRLIRLTQTSIDALGRDQWTYDSGAVVATSYDAAGNRRHVTVNLNVNGTNTQKDLWYGYDAANRVIYDGGVELNIAYEQGFRIKETNKDGLFRELFYNDPDGLFTDEKYYQLGRGTGQVVQTHREYTPTGVLKNYTESDGEKVYFTHHIDTNNQGWQYNDTQKLEDKTTTTTYADFTHIGLPKTQDSNYPNDIKDRMTNTYIPFDEMKLWQVSGRRYDKYGWGDCAVATRYYDPNGTVVYEEGLQDEFDPNSSKTLNKLFTTTHDGKILLRDTYKVDDKSPRVWFDLRIITNFKKSDRAHYFYNINNQLIASYGTDLTDPNYGVMNNYLQHYQTRIKSGFHGIEPSKAQATVNQARVPHLFLPDFAMTYPAPVPEKIIVAPHDTFALIAQRMYGNPGFASAIAGLNGFSLDTKLIGGQVLRLPQYLPNTNNADNSMPYQRFIGIMLGNLYPHLELKQPPPPSSGGGWFSSFIHAIVDAIAIVVGVAIGILMPASLAALIPLVAGVVTALGDAAYQGVAVAVGWQDHFSLIGALTAGIEAGITVGILGPETILNSITGVTKAAATSAQTLILETGKIAVACQLTEMAMGQRDKFDFGAIISSVASAALFHEIAPMEERLPFKTNKYVGAVLHSEVKGFLSGGIKATLDHQQLDAEGISARALGSTIGHEVGVKIGKEVIDYAKAQQGSVKTIPTVSSPKFQPSHNPGRNANGFFAEKNTNKSYSKTKSEHVVHSQTNKTAQSNENRTTWQSHSPKEVSTNDEAMRDSGENPNIIYKLGKGMADAVNDKFGEYIKEHHIVSNNFDKYMDSKAAAEKALREDGKWTPAFKYNMVMSSKYAFSATLGIMPEFIKDVGRVFEIKEGVNHVIDAAPSDKLNVTVHEVTKVMAGYTDDAAGAAAGGYLSSLFAPEIAVSLGIELEAVPVVGWFLGTAIASVGGIEMGVDYYSKHEGKEGTTAFELGLHNVPVVGPILVPAAEYYVKHESQIDNFIMGK